MSFFPLVSFLLSPLPVTRKESRIKKKNNGVQIVSRLCIKERDSFQPAAIVEVRNGLFFFYFFTFWWLTILSFIYAQAGINNAKKTIDQLCDEHGHANASIALGVQDPLALLNLKNIVKLTIRYLKEKIHSVGLCIENPVSFSEGTYSRILWDRTMYHNLDYNVSLIIK